MIWFGLFATVAIGYGWLKIRRNRKASPESH
jgi:hypothetical protein